MTSNLGAAWSLHQALLFTQHRSVDAAVPSLTHSWNSGDPNGTDPARYTREASGSKGSLWTVPRFCWVPWQTCQRKSKELSPLAQVQTLTPCNANTCTLQWFNDWNFQNSLQKMSLKHSSCYRSRNIIKRLPETCRVALTGSEVPLRPWGPSGPGRPWPGSPVGPLAPFSPTGT